MIEIKPTKTFRGTWEEILTHQGEIPSGSTIEVRVFEPVQDIAESNNGTTGGRTLGEIISEIGFVEGGPSDLGRNAEEYLAKSDFGVTKESA